MSKNRLAILATGLCLVGVSDTVKAQQTMEKPSEKVYDSWGNNEEFRIYSVFLYIQRNYGNHQLIGSNTKDSFPVD